MQKRVIALGFFDGVHLGHGALLSRTVNIARKANVSSAALLFDRHPSHIVSNNPVPLINTAEERALLMKGLYNIDTPLPLKFDTACATLPWDEFVKKVLINDFGACHVVAGFDFRFGYRGEGCGDKLYSLCKELGVGCDIIERVELDGQTISSSLIRDLIAQGDVSRAAKFLGHNHFIYSPVKHGAALGRTIGIPTINQHFESNICTPKFGVYATRVHIGTSVFRGVTNIGTRPTVSDKMLPRAETFILDYSGDLYSQCIGIEFLDMLRPERKFDSIDDLRQAIDTDIQRAREY